MLKLGCSGLSQMLFIFEHRVTESQSFFSVSSENLIYGLCIFRSLHQLDVLRLYLHGGGETALLKVDDQTLHLAALLGHQTARDTVELAAHYADLLAI